VGLRGARPSDHTAGDRRHTEKLSAIALSEASPTVPIGTHTHLLATLAEGDAGVLATMVAVVHHALGPALLQRHVQRREHQIAAHLLG